MTVELAAKRALVTRKVWRPDGMLAWANLAPERIGRRFEIDGHLGEALETGGRGGSRGALRAQRGRGRGAARGRPRLRGLRAGRSARGKVVGAYEIYADPRRSRVDRRAPAHDLGDAPRVFLVLWLALALLVRGASALTPADDRAARPLARSCSSRTGGSRRARSRRSRA